MQTIESYFDFVEGETFRSHICFSLTVEHFGVVMFYSIILKS